MLAGSLRAERLGGDSLLASAGARARRLALDGRDPGHRFTGRKTRLKGPRPEKILLRVEPALGLQAMPEMPIPVRAGEELAAIDQQTDRCARPRMR